jgi:hypothetical protein
MKSLIPCAIVRAELAKPGKYVSTCQASTP